MNTMNSVRVKRLAHIALLDPYLIILSLAFSAVLFATNQQANLYDIQNPRWVITMGVLILLSPIAHSLFLTRVRVTLGKGNGSLRDGIGASAAFYSRLVGGEVVVSLIAAAGLFLLLLPGIYIGVRLSLYKQAILFDGKTMTAALRESMARTASWSVIGIIFLVFALIYGMEVLVGYLAGTFLTQRWGIVIAVIAAALGFSGINTFLSAIYFVQEP